MEPKYLTIETQRFVVYYKQDGIVHREVFYSKEDVYSKYSMAEIIVLNTDDPILTELRSSLLDKELDEDFLTNLSSPLDNDKVCKSIINALASGNSFATAFRMAEDRPYSFVRLDTSTQEKVTFDVLKEILNNYEELCSHFRCLNTDTFRQIYSYRDNDDILREYVKRMIHASNINEYGTDIEEIKRNRASNYELIAIYQTLFDFQQEHTGTYSEINSTKGYDERLYLNCHDSNTLFQFMGEYAKECIRNHIDYNSKGLFSSDVPNTSDTTILYTQHRDLKTRIRILEGIMNIHPEWREVFSAPIYGGLSLGTGFYSLTHKGTDFNTYSNYYEYALEILRASLIAKTLINDNLISSSDEKYDIVRRLSELDGLVADPNSIIYMQINGITLNKICPILKAYLKEEKVQEGIKKTSPEEFRDRLYKIHASFQGFDPALKIPLGINKSMIENFGYTKKQNKGIDKLKADIEKKSNEAYDIDGDGYISINEVIRIISKKLERHMLTGKNFEEKKLMAALKQELDDCRHNNRYDVELITQLKEALDMYEKNNGGVESLGMLLNLNGEFKKGRESGVGSALSDSIFKDATIKLFFSFYDKSKEIVGSLQSLGYNYNGEELKDIRDCISLMHSSFERSKGIPLATFDMNRYEQFRDIFKTISMDIKARADVVKQRKL